MNNSHTITAAGEILFDVFPDGKKMGGAPFNFFHHVFRFTGRGKFVSRIGADANGMAIEQFLNDRDLPDAYVQRDHVHPTGTVKVTLSGKGIPEYEIVQPVAYDFISLDDKLIDAVKNGTAMFYFGSLAQRNSVSHHTIVTLAELAPKCFCDINLRQEFYNYDILKRSFLLSDVLKLNVDELHVASDYFLQGAFDLHDSAKAIAGLFDIDLVCVTMGEDGSLLFRNGEFHFYKAEAPYIADTVGAGDAYASLLCIGYIENWNLQKINKLASEFAAAVCTLHGALPADPSFYDTFSQQL